MLFSLWWTAMFLSSWVTIITWNVLNAILLGGLCELIACSMCNLFFSFLVLAEITMVVMKPMRIIVIAVKGVGAWFYSQPLLQTVCFTKELYRVSLRLNMIYTNLHIWVFLCILPHGQHSISTCECEGTILLANIFSDLIGAFLNTGASPPPPASQADAAIFWQLLRV